MPKPPPKRFSPPSSRPRSTFEPRIRKGTVRVQPEVASRLRSGHPYVFREALGGRPLRENAGEMIEIVDPSGEFVARGLYDPENIVAVRVFTRDRAELLDLASVKRRVVAAQKLREGLIPADTNAYRVINAEADGLPGITIDRYGDYVVSQLFSPATSAIAELVYDAIEEIYKPRSIYEQKRFRPQTGEGPRAPATLERGVVAPVEFEVKECGLKFLVDVTAPLSTGLFPDLREGRRAVAQHAKGRRVLNLFSYTGAFSLYAAHAGAREVVSVDLAQRVHARARKNFELNGIPERSHEFIVGDSFKVLAKMAERGRKFDLIVIDPPSFSQSKTGVFSMQKDYRDLIQAALAVAAPNGLMACVSNTHKVSWDELDRTIGEAAGNSGRYVRVIQRLGLPPDFPVLAGHVDGHYLKFLLCAAA